jgi:DNA-binding CsgD family transcriptional regulator
VARDVQESTVLNIFGSVDSPNDCTERNIVLPVNTVELRPGGTFRSCVRCGVEFRRDGGNRICASCRNSTRRRMSTSPKLSFREKQVIDLVSQAKLNKEIAYELHLTEGTIKEYLHRIFRKIGTANRTELAVWALTHMAEQHDKYVA